MKNDLEKKLDQYEDVFLFRRNTGYFEAAFAGSKILRESEKTIWVYSGNAVFYPENVSCGRISLKEEMELLTLYHIYEFSNRFHVVACGEICGTLFNYMEQGLLSEAEVIKALLY